MGVDVQNNSDNFVQFGRFNFQDDSYNGPTALARRTRRMLLAQRKDFCINVFGWTQSGAHPHGDPGKRM